MALAMDSRNSGREVSTPAANGGTGLIGHVRELLSEGLSRLSVPPKFGGLWGGTAVEHQPDAVSHEEHHATMLCQYSIAEDEERAQQLSSGHLGGSAQQEARELIWRVADTNITTNLESNLDRAHNRIDRIKRQHDEETATREQNDERVITNQMVRNFMDKVKQLLTKAIARMPGASAVASTDTEGGDSA